MADELYHDDLIGLLEMVWGEGFLSPGGTDEIDRVIDGIDLRGRRLLDIGCGVGGVDLHLVRSHGLAHVTGIDVEDTVVDIARSRAVRDGLDDRTTFVKVDPGPLPFPESSFEVVFSKDSIVHIPDKHALARDVYRVLEPGGWFVASDWLIGHDGTPSEQMRDYIAAEGLDFEMASAARYDDALRSAGFVDVSNVSRHEWYVEVARDELARMSGSLYEPSVARFGKPFVDHNLDIWSKMLVVLATGEHRPTHLRARRP
jgi:ubiquinone/menaquinone biosynthesis C-methylase UbiE